ncbi:hypothetical protein [Micromonospora profundi]|uniref:hypothetical protein n=1 Tax=Micromonospora profundi TaxID=1420889 RepID=UPI00364C860C
MSSEAYVYDAVRTPRGRGRDTGALHGVKPISLVVGLIDALRERNPGLDVGRLEDLLLGIVTPVGEQGGDVRQYAGGPAGFAARATELASRYGDRFTPPADLEDRLAARTAEPAGVA